MPAKAASSPQLADGSGVATEFAAALVAAGITARAAAIFFSRHPTGSEVVAAFHSENAFYYSFYSQLVQAPGLTEGLRQLRSDDLSEAPAEVNALRRFNIYQEVLCSFLWRVCARVTQVLYHFDPDPALFYCGCTFAFYGLGILAFSANASGAGPWGVLLAGALYFNNLEEASHVSFMPPLRENFGVPLWFASCAAIQRLHRVYCLTCRQGGAPAPRSGRLLWARALLVLSSTGFLIAWQFASFALSLQWAAVLAAALAGAAPWAFLAEVSRLQALAALLSSAARCGDVWALRGLFFRVSASAAIAGFRLGASTAPRLLLLLLRGLAFAGLLVASAWPARWLVVWSEGEEALNDDAHIFEFLRYRLGLYPGPLSYHAALYDGQRSFSSPRWDDWQQLGRTLLLPAAAAGGARAAWGLARAAEGPERWGRFPQAFLLALAGATGVLFQLMLRYRMLCLPHLALLGSQLAASASAAAGASAGGFRLRGAGLWVAALAVVLGFRQPTDVGGRGPSPSGSEDAAERGLLLDWLRENATAGDVVVSDMGLSALVRLHARRPVVCHPHYESARLRRQCLWASKLYGHRSLEELHGVLRERLLPGLDLRRRRVLVAVEVRSCFSVDEKGRSISQLIEQDAPERWQAPKACQNLHLAAGGQVPVFGFQPLFVGRWFALLAALPDPTERGVPLPLEHRSICGIGRYLSEELDRPRAAIPLFLRLPQSPEDLDVSCACAASQYWSTELLPMVHRRALLLRGSREAGALGCCQWSSQLLGCLSQHSRSLEQAGDLLAAAEYQSHAAQVAPLDARSHGLLGFALVKEGRYQAAMESFQEAIKVEGSSPSPTTKCGLALALAGLGEMGAAAEAVRSSADLEPQRMCERANWGILEGAETTHLLGLYGRLQRAWETYDAGVSGWRAFAFSPVAEEYVQQQFTGQALLFLGSPRLHFPMALQSLQVLRTAHKCDWPAEFWMEAGELHLLAEEQRAALTGLGPVTIRVLPSPYGAWRRSFWDWRANLTQRWGQRAGAEQKLQKYALKALVPMLSGCSVCLVLDADSLPLQPPERLLRPGAEPGQGTATLFWHDLWDRPGGGVATLWKEAMGSASGKSQESGQLLISKDSEAAKRALLLASLLAVRMDIFLEAIYALEGGGLMCGYGDKDTFHLAFRLLEAPFRFVAPLPAVLLDKRRQYVGMLQLDEASEPLFLHAAWAKEEAAEALLAGLRRCDFRRQQDAAGITCNASADGSVRLPLDRMDCRPLSFPAEASVLAVLRGRL